MRSRGKSSVILLEVVVMQTLPIYDWDRRRHELGSGTCKYRGLEDAGSLFNIPYLVTVENTKIRIHENCRKSRKLTEDIFPPFLKVIYCEQNNFIYIMVNNCSWNEV